MFWRPPYQKITAQAADALTTLVSFVAAYYLWQFLRLSFPTRGMGSDITLDHTSLIIMLVAAVLWGGIFNIQGAYSYQRFTSFATEIKVVGKTVLLGSLLLIGLVFLTRPGYIPRTLVALFALVNFALLSLEKLLLFHGLKLLRRLGHNRKTVLVAGTGDQTRRFVNTIQKHFNWGLDIVGYLDATEDRVGQEIFGKRILGTFADIIPVLHAYPLDEVIITVSTKRMGEIRSVLEACELEGVQVRLISNFLGEIAKKIRAEVIYDLPIISISHVPGNDWALACKRILDIVVASVALAILAPVFLIIAAAIKATSPGPVFYQWNVVGFNKKPFKSWKFRTMGVDADSRKKDLLPLNEMEGPVFKIKDDPRVTPIGRFLRKYSLDELPQLWSVVKGDMSLVGPRPAGPQELARYQSWQRRKLSIKPGITCLWQVNGRNTIHRFDDWVKMDLEYVDNWSLGLDLKIIFQTIVTVFKGTGV